MSDAPDAPIVGVYRQDVFVDAHGGRIGIMLRFTNRRPHRGRLQNVL